MHGTGQWKVTFVGNLGWRSKWSDVLLIGNKMLLEITVDIDCHLSVLQILELACVILFQSFSFHSGMKNVKENWPLLDLSSSHSTLFCSVFCFTNSPWTLLWSARSVVYFSWAWLYLRLSSHQPSSTLFRTFCNLCSNSESNNATFPSADWFWWSISLEVSPNFLHTSNISDEKSSITENRTGDIRFNHIRNYVSQTSM